MKNQLSWDQRGQFTYIYIKIKNQLSTGSIYQYIYIMKNQLSTGSIYIYIYINKMKNQLSWDQQD